jgi:hypothetical protein
VISVILYADIIEGYYFILKCDAVHSGYQCLREKIPPASLSCPTVAMVAVCSSEILVNTSPNTGHHIPEGSVLPRMRWAGHVARMGENRNAYRILVGMPEGKRPLGRSRRRWVDNIEMDLREIGWDGVDWIDMT